MNVDTIKKNILSGDTHFGYYLVRLGKPLYLISCGVYCKLNEIDKDKKVLIDILSSIKNKVDDICSTIPIPFAIPIIDDMKCYFICGFAGKPWVVDMVEWVYTTKDFPKGIHDCIIGMLCGYDLESIQKFIDNRIKIDGI